jgi:outer membrane protein assembly factor BamA
VGTDVRHAGSSGWVRYGATAGGFVDLNGRNRVLSLWVATLFADPLGKDPIPFTELVELGGAGAMRGFYPGRLRDRSAAVATIHYRWPIWAWLDGSLQMSTGNVFGDHLSLLEASRARLAGAIGIESVGARDGSFELLVGAGTETWERGHRLDSLRIQLGTNRGF